MVDTGRVAGALLFSKGKAYICPTLLRLRKTRTPEGMSHAPEGKTRAPEGKTLKGS